MALLLCRKNCNHWGYSSVLLGCPISLLMLLSPVLVQALQVFFLGVSGAGLISLLYYMWMLLLSLSSYLLVK